MNPTATEPIMNPTDLMTRYSKAMNPTTTDPKTADTMTTHKSLLREASGGGQGGETTRGGVITRSQSGPASLRLWGRGGGD